MEYPPSGFGIILFNLLYFNYLYKDTTNFWIFLYFLYFYFLKTCAGVIALAYYTKPPPTFSKSGSTRRVVIKNHIS